jgi:hypothetical protein
MSGRNKRSREEASLEESTSGREKSATLGRDGVNSDARPSFSWPVMGTVLIPIPESAKATQDALGTQITPESIFLQVS